MGYSSNNNTTTNSGGLNASSTTVSGNGTSLGKDGDVLQKIVSSENGLTQTQSEEGALSPGKEVPVRWQS